MRKVYVRSVIVAAIAIGISACSPSNSKEVDMGVKLPNTEQDKQAILSIVEEMSKSMSAEQSTKHWADDALWFDVPPFASKGLVPARKQFDTEFAKVSSFVVEIVSADTFINGDMAVVCTVQKWNVTKKDGTQLPPMLIRLTDCFERRGGHWKVIHEHSSVPVAPGWDGKIARE
jgi:ketosteroid isomerase-like protein